MKLYEEQQDGSLQPLKMSETLAKRLHIYQELTNKGVLTLEEVKWLASSEAMTLD